MDRRLVRLSKFLSLVLRHRPERIGLTLDEAGWADVSELIEKSRTGGVPFDEALLQRVVDENDKKRYQLSEDGRRIRASQGHSIDVDLGLPWVEPPEILFHGTAMRFSASIRKRGLEARSRRHVHLSVDETTARRVGARHGAPLILRIRAGEMHRGGIPFFRSDNDVWLTEAVPAMFIDFPEGEDR